MCFCVWVALYVKLNQILHNGTKYSDGLRVKYSTWVFHCMKSHSIPTSQKKTNFEKPWSRLKIDLAAHPTWLPGLVSRQRGEGPRCGGPSPSSIHFPSLPQPSDLRLPSCLLPWRSVVWGLGKPDNTDQLRGRGKVGEDSCWGRDWWGGVGEWWVRN